MVFHELSLVRDSDQKEDSRNRGIMDLIDFTALIGIILREYIDNATVEKEHNIFESCHFLQ